MIPVVLLMGPTGSGKSALAMALAERFPVEIVSVDPRRSIAAWTSGRRNPTPRRARGCRIICSTSSSRSRPIRPRVFAPMRFGRSPPSGRAAPFRCSSAGRCSTSRRCRRGFPRCRSPIRPCARVFPPAPPSKAGPRCTPNSRASIP